MLAIAIVSGVGYLLSIIKHASKGKVDVDLILATVLILSTWSVLPLAIVIIVFTVVMGIIGAMVNLSEK
jgi:hypothetical protein